MSFEVDVRAVGKKSKSGDAICFRYGDFSSRKTQTVVVVDGGFSESGEDLVTHIQRYYGTAHVDFVISTHPDSDHVCGLRHILENLSVAHLLMHRPWTYTESAKRILSEAQRKVPQSFSYIERTLTDASELEALALKKGIPITEPFAGVRIEGGVGGDVHVLGPTQEYYGDLLPGFGGTADRGFTLSVPLEKLRKWIQEHWHKDTLVEPAADAVSAVNNSSAILRADFGSSSFLFTADAGVPALTNAVNYAVGEGIDVSSIGYVQIPHHGSKRNVGPSILNYLIGPIAKQEGYQNGKRTFISAAVDGAPKHPSKRVTNAVVRRGGGVFVTRGTSHCYRSPDVPMRSGWSALESEPFHAQHEEED